MFSYNIPAFAVQQCPMQVDIAQIGKNCPTAAATASHGRPPIGAVNNLANLPLQVKQQLLFDTIIVGKCEFYALKQEIKMKITESGFRGGIQLTEFSIFSLGPKDSISFT